MTEPEEAVVRAREQAAAMRAEGAYDEIESRARPAAGPITLDKLLEWALTDPDTAKVRSTRRFGAPMTAVKRGLLRLLAQYHGELLAEQSRFNAGVVQYVRELERRISELERRT
jgi:hypothetical protein